MIKTISALLGRLGSLGFVLWILWIGWGQLGPRHAEIGRARQEVACAVMPQVVEDIRVGRGEKRDAVLMPLAGDPSGYVTDLVRRAVEQSGVLNLRDTTVEEKFRSIMNLRPNASADIEVARERGRGRGVTSVLFGDVGDFESTPKGTRFVLNLKLLETATGTLLLEKQYERSAAGETKFTVATSEGVQHGDRSEYGITSFKSSLQRWLGWAVLVLALPMFTIGFIRSLVVKSSNSINAFVLAAYTLLDIALAVLVAKATFGDWKSGLISGVAILLAALYNCGIMSYALKLETSR